ncbi:hypothetical protein PTTG_09301 [Puccinia triticina 1-1 BBBD Race 1]|uniref:Uncharacterized protein n=1 Tax=Puccinia triticina (isolate 1-1 / race 1 (BBBD)) TaxID=630390 RepID=A0A180GGK5_PUCT1|nr:hypothetical protein PTTG_09301 [Puccinia triticina 1-1 BBBD Race 1]
MSFGTELQSGSLLEQPDQEEPRLDSKVIRLMITVDTPHRQEGLHESRFIECMDYSISSFEVDPRVQQASSKLTASVGAAAPSQKPPPIAPRPITRGLGSFVRKLSLRASPKRDLKLSPPSGLIQLEQVPPNSSYVDAVNLCRKKSDKCSRLISPLVIVSGKNEPWRVGFGKKTFTPSSPLNSAVSPISSLCSSTSGSSTHSELLETPQDKPDGSTEAGLGRPAVQRSNSITQCCIPPPISLRSTSTSSTNTSGQTFEVLSRSNISKSKNGSSDGKNLIPTSFSLFSKSLPLPTDPTKTAAET